MILTKVRDDDFDGPVAGCGGVRLWRHEVDWSVDPPTTSFAALPTACGANFDNAMCGFSNRSCIPQLGTTQRLDPVDELQVYRAHYRHWPTYDSIMVDTTVDTGGDRAGQHWVELRNSGSGWAIHQEGTYGPEDGLNRWLGSIAMDGDGNYYTQEYFQTTGRFDFNTKVGPFILADCNADRCGDGFCDAASGECGECGVCERDCSRSPSC